jgi:hypothetical protein
MTKGKTNYDIAVEVGAPKSSSQPTTFGFNWWLFSRLLAVTAELAAWPAKGAKRQHHVRGLD